MFEVETDNNLEGTEVSSNSLTINQDKIDIHFWASPVLYTALGSNSGLEVTMTTQISMAKAVAWCTDSLRWLATPWVSIWTLMVTGTMDINPDPGCRRARHGPSCSSVLDISMAPGGSAGHSGQYGAVAV